MYNRYVSTTNKIGMTVKTIIIFKIWLVGKYFNYPNPNQLLWSTVIQLLFFWRLRSRFQVKDASANCDTAIVITNSNAFILIVAGTKMHLVQIHLKTYVFLIQMAEVDIFAWKSLVPTIGEVHFSTRRNDISIAFQSISVLSTGGVTS